MGIVVVPAVVVHEAARPVAVEDAPRALHGLARECRVVDVEPVDAVFAHEVVEALEVEVVPARVGRGDHGEVETGRIRLREAHVLAPRGEDVEPHVRAQPGMRTAPVRDGPARHGRVALQERLAVERLEREELRQVLRQLARRVIDFQEKSRRMGVLHGLLEKRTAVVVVRIVDVRVPDRVVVEVHDRRAHLARGGRVERAVALAEVPVPVAEVRLHVKLVERRDVEVEVPLRARRRVLPNRADRRHVGGFLDRHHAAAGGPAFGHSQLLPRIVGVDERPPVVRALEAHGEAAVDTAHPHRVAVEVRIPFLLHLPLREDAAVDSETFPKPRDVHRHGEFKRRLRNLAAHVADSELTRPREVDASFDDTRDAARDLSFRLPRRVRGGNFREGELLLLYACCLPSPGNSKRTTTRFETRFELHRRGEEVHSLLDDTRVGTAEVRDDLRGQAVFAQHQLAPENLHRAASRVDDDGLVRLRHGVLASDVGVEPLESRKTPGVADTAILQHVALHLDLERDGRARGVRRIFHAHLALQRLARRVLRDVDHHPDRLHALRGDRARFRRDAAHHEVCLRVPAERARLFRRDAHLERIELARLSDAVEAFRRVIALCEPVGGHDVVAHRVLAVLAEKVERGGMRGTPLRPRVRIDRVLHPCRHLVRWHHAAGGVGDVVLRRSNLAQGEPVDVVAVRDTSVRQYGVRGLRGGVVQDVEVRAHHVGIFLRAVFGVEDASRHVVTALGETKLHALRVAAVEQLALRLQGFPVVEAARVADTAVTLAHRACAVRAHAPRLVETTLRETHVRELDAREQDRVVRRRHEPAALRRVPHPVSADCGKRTQRRRHCGTHPSGSLAHSSLPFDFSLKTQIV